MEEIHKVPFILPSHYPHQPFRGKGTENRGMIKMYINWSEWSDLIVSWNLFKCRSPQACPVQFRKSIGYYLFLTVDTGALPTLCLCDILVNLRLCCETVVMVFYFGFAVLCVFFLYFVRILWYFSPCRKIWGNLTGCWRLIFVVLRFFCFLLFLDYGPM